MKKKITWQTKIILILVLLVIVGFIQWDNWFSLEIRNETLQSLAYGRLAFGASFFLICFGFTKLIRLAKSWLLGVLFFIVPFLIMIVGLIWLFATILPLRDWKDIYVYQNGNDYLIVQNMVDPMMEDNEYLRLIRTSSPTGMIRRIEEQSKLYFDEEIYSKGNNAVKFSNKIWHKVQLKK